MRHQDEVGCGAELLSSPVLGECPGRARGGFNSYFISIYDNLWLLGLGCGKGRGAVACVLGMEKLSLLLSMDRWTASCHLDQQHL